MDIWSVGNSIFVMNMNIVEHQCIYDIKMYVNVLLQSSEYVYG